MPTHRLRCLLGAVVLVVAAGRSALGQDIPLIGPSVDFSHGPLQVSENRRFLEHRDGTPFLYLGDTAWELFHRLTREDAERYLELRRAQGFTVIQAVVLVEFDGLTAPNAYGDRPLKDNDPGQSNEAYFAHVDWIVKKAAQKGLFVGTGVVKAIGTFTNHSTRRFDPPGSPGRGEDWVLVLDDTGYEYKPPAHRAPPVPSR
jgi:hypothetical protein